MANSPTASTDTLRAGEEVILRVAGSERRGIVIEDRGPLGLGGRQIVLIRVGNEDEDRQFEVRAEDLERVAGP